MKLWWSPYALFTSSFGSITCCSSPHSRKTSCLSYSCCCCQESSSGDTFQRWHQLQNNYSPKITPWWDPPIFKWLRKCFQHAQSLKHQTDNFKSGLLPEFLHGIRHELTLSLGQHTNSTKPNHTSFLFHDVEYLSVSSPKNPTCDTQQNIHQDTSSSFKGKWIFCLSGP